MQALRNVAMLVRMIAAIALFAIAGCASSQLAKGDQSFANDDLNELNQWAQNYYTNPHPELFYASFDLLNRNRAAAASGYPFLVTFYGELYRRYPDRVNEWITRIESWTLNDMSESILCNYLKFSGTDQTEGMHAIAKRPEDLDGAGKIRWGSDLDALWGRFFATGDKNRVVKIISTLERLPEKMEGTVKGAEAIDVVVAAAAEWSLTANSRQHKDVLTICKEQISQTSSPKIRKHLEKMVIEAEKAK